MTWRHPIAAVVEDASRKQRLGFTPCDLVTVELLIEPSLHRIKQLSIDYRRLFAGEDLSLESYFPDVKPIA